MQNESLLFAFVTQGKTKILCSFWQHFAPQCFTSFYDTVECYFLLRPLGRKFCLLVQEKLTSRRTITPEKLTVALTICTSYYIMFLHKSYS